jgi:hypothetical protein
MAERTRPEKKRGAKGGIKHPPGRDHDWKSARGKKKKYQRKAAQKRAAREAEARRQWEEWDALDDARKKLRPDLFPKVPRPEAL